MAATRPLDFHTQSHTQHVPATEGGVRPGVIGPQAFVHLWLLLVILGAIGVLVLSIPTPVYAFGLEAFDPTLAGWLDLVT